MLPRDRKPRVAFYALLPGGWRDYITVLHLPYTAWHLSYVVLGAVAAPVLHAARLGGVVLAFFLAVGLAAHVLDELRGRPLGTQIPQQALVAIGVGALSGAFAIGGVAAVTISAWVVPFIVVGGFLVLAYNLEWWGGRFHTDAWFGLAWGGFPALVGYWSQAERLRIEAVAVAGGCCALSLAQRALSSYVRKVRRRSQSVEGRVALNDGRTEIVTAPYLLAAPELALRWMTAAVVALALGLLAAKTWG